MSEQARLRALRRYELGQETQAPFGAGSYTEGVVLIVGEAHTEKFVPADEKIDNRLQAPFCSMQGCSGWLNELLETAGIDENKLFWVNTIHDGVYTDLQILVNTLKPSAIVALGETANVALKASGIMTYYVYHPQYWKRFKSKEEYPLIPLLRELTCVGS